MTAMEMGMKTLKRKMLFGDGYLNESSEKNHGSAKKSYLKKSNSSQKKTGEI